MDLGTVAEPFWKMYVNGAKISLQIAMGIGSSQEKYSRQAVEALRGSLPYCLHPITQTEEKYIWLNRDYKPLGILSKDWVNYEKFHWSHISKPELMTLPFLPELKNDGECYWFFDDGNAPWYSRKDSRRLYEILDRV